MSTEIVRARGGFMATCDACGWVAIHLTRVRVETAATKHVAAHDKEKPAPKATPRRGRSDWNSREDSTWIDKL